LRLLPQIKTLPSFTPTFGVYKEFGTDLIFILPEPAFKILVAKIGEWPDPLKLENNLLELLDS